MFFCKSSQYSQIWATIEKAFVFLIFFLPACNSGKVAPEAPLTERVRGLYDPQHFFDSISEKENIGEKNAAYLNLIDFLLEKDSNRILVQHLPYIRLVFKDEPTQKARMMEVVALGYTNLSLFDSASLLLHECQAIHEKEKDPIGAAKAISGEAKNQAAKGNIQLAVELYLEANKMYQENDALAPFYENQIELATIFFFQKEFGKSLDLHTKSLEYYESMRDTAQMAYILDGITVAQNNLGQLDKAVESGERSIKLYESLGDDRGLSVALNNIAHLFKRTNQLEKAEPLLRHGLALMEESNDKNYTPICRSNLGNCLLDLNRLDEAKAQLIKAERELKALNNGPTRERLNVESALARVNAKLGIFSEAYKYQLASSATRDSLNTAQQRKELAKTSALYENAEKQSEIDRLQHQNEMKSLYSIMLILGALSIVAFIGFYFYSKIKRQKAIFAKEKELFIERERVSAVELLHAQTQLKNYGNTVQEKTKLIKELQERISSDPEALVSKPAETIDLYLSELYAQRILTNDDWEEFKILFSKVYPGFSENLRLAYSDMTPAELRLSMLIKLSLESREIASMLGVSPDSVKKTRQRLRRRLGLAKEDGLEDFIFSFNV